MNETYGIVNCDCFELLKTIPDNTIDLGIYDPPYFRVLTEHWDNQWASEENYLIWAKAWTDEVVRVTKPGGSIYVWGTTKHDTFLKYKLNCLNRNELIYNNWIIWAYDWGGRTKQTFPRKHEDLLGYSKIGAERVWYPEQIKVPQKMAKDIRTGKIRTDGKIPTDVWDFEIDHDVWTMNNHTTSKEFCSWHPTQKPIKLLERIILAHTKEDDTVLDIFSGSGSTAIAAIKNNRKFIGSERSEEYFKKSLERIKNLL